jgi:hypothetical protein
VAACNPLAKDAFGMTRHTLVAAATEALRTIGAVPD